jgi:hypothetical protein
MIGAVQQCVAADEAGASDGASQLNAVFGGRHERAHSPQLVVRRTAYP